jgi:hypothetical protein
VENELRRAMTVQLIISPPARGKTRQCARLVCDHLAQNVLQTVWTVLPALQHYNAFQRHLGDFGGAMGAPIPGLSNEASGAWQRRHSDQMRWYGRAVQQILSQTPELKLCFLNSNRECRLSLFQFLSDFIFQLR